MLEFNTRQKTLKMFRKGTAEIPHNVLTTPKTFYLKFMAELEELIRDDICEMIRKVVPEANFRFTSVRLENRMLEDPREEKVLPRGRVSVIVDVSSKNMEEKGITLLSMPSMDTDGTFNGKTVVNELVKREGLSFDFHTNELLLVLPRTQMLFGANTNDIYLKGFDGKKLNLYDLLIASSILLDGKEHDDAPEEVNKQFSNHLIMNYLGKKRHTVPLLAIDNADKFAERSGGFLNYLTSDRMFLGSARRVLNQHLSLDKCLGKVLAEDVTVILDDGSPFTILRRGTTLQSKMISILKERSVNRVYVEYLPNVAGMKLGESVNIPIIPKGAKVTPLVVAYCQDKDYADYAYMPEDVKVNVFLSKDTALTTDMIQLMHDGGIPQFTLKNNPFPITFKHEIIGNGTVALKDLFSGKKIPEEVLKYYDKDDSIYYPAYKELGGNPSILTMGGEAARERLMPNYLTVHDIFSLVNFYCGVRTLPDVFRAYHKDIDFLKKVRPLNETLKDIILQAGREYTHTYKNAIKNAVTGASTQDKIIGTFTLFEAAFLKVYNGKLYNKLVKTAEYTNPLALISQPLRVVTPVDSKRASAHMRAVVMGHYGRLCPYDTPVGDTIGLATSLTSGARFDETGELLSPYHPIVERGGQFYISKEIKYLSSAEELNKRIGDIISVEHIRTLKTREETFTVPLAHQYTVARVPAPQDEAENITVEMVYATELDFVCVQPEQAFSPVANLIPFMGADDGVRVSYTISMLKQGVYIHGSELPMVKTPMGEKVLSEDESFLVRAREDSTIVDITPNAVITDKGDIPIRGIKVTKQSFTALDFRKKIGDAVKRGEVIADTVVSREGEFTLGTNLLVAYMPYYGYNYEDGYVLSQAAADKFVSNWVNEVKMDLKKGSVIQSNFNADTTMYVAEGDTIFSWLETSKKSGSQRHKEYRTSTGQSGIVYNIRSSYDRASETESRIATLIEFDRVNNGDKFSGYHGNKGTSALVNKNSEQPCFANGVVLDILANTCGVPSRMNMGQILEAHVGFCAYLLGIRVESASFNGATEQDVKELLEFCWDLCNAENQESALSKWAKIYPQELIEHTKTRFTVMRKWRDCFNKDGSARLYNPKTGKYFENAINFGMGYFFKLHHQVDHKLTARSGGDAYDYNLIDKQPTQGKAKGGGQRIGEMEYFALAAYGATSVLSEMYNEKSDNLVLRDELNYSGDDRNVPHSDLWGNSTRGSELLRYYLEVCGIKAEFIGGSDISLHSIQNRRSIKDRAMLNASKSTVDAERIKAVVNAIDDYDFEAGSEEVVDAGMISTDPYESDVKGTISTDPYSSDI